MKPDNVQIISIAEATIKVSRPIVGVGDDGVVYEYDKKSRTWHLYQ